MIRHLLKLVWNRKRANALIVAEILVSFVVVFAVITGVVTFASNWAQPLGYDWRNVWVVRMDIPFSAVERGGDELRAQMMRMIDETRSLPGVTAAAMSSTPAYAFSTRNTSREIDGRVISFTVDDVTDGFADVMRMEVVRGRWFDSSDDASPYHPVVIDETFARNVWGDADQVGRKLEPGREEGELTMHIVGVVRSYRKDGETSAPEKMMFQRISPNAAYGRPGNNIVLRVQPGTPAQVEEQLAKRLQAVAPDLPLEIRQMDAMRARALRMRLAPIVAGGIVALFLVSMVGLGLTGVLWQNVTRRTREVGLRRAMGATGPGVHRQILAEVVLLATLALGIGTIVIAQLPILGAFSVVTPAAFTTGLIGALATIYVLTVLCGLYPSWLASRLQPADALRYE